MQKVELIEPTENEGVSSKQSWGTQIQIAQHVNLEPTTIQCINGTCGPDFSSVVACLCDALVKVWFTKYNL